MGYGDLVVRQVTFFVLFGLFACSTSPGEQYLGEWQNKDIPGDKLRIVRNGDTFLIFQRKRGLVLRASDAGKEEKLPAVLEAGMLRVQIFSTPTIAYVQATDTLTTQGLAGEIEYQRVKPKR